MATKMHIEHTFPCSADTLVRVLNDEEFDKRLMQALDIRREVQRADSSGDINELVLKLTPSTNLPGFMKKLVKDSSYIEHRRWDVARRRCDWRIEVSFSDKVDMHGTMEVIPEGEARCKRVNDGHFEVRVALVGGQVEKFIIRQTEESFEKAAVFIRQYLKDNGLEGT